MDIVGRRLAEAYPAANAGTTVHLSPITEEHNRRVGRSREALLITQSVVTFVLLIACAHVAALVLARSAVREEEFAVRAVLGARRLRLVRQLLTESLLLVFFGSLLGLLIARWSLAQQIQKFLPWYIDLGMDARSLLCVVAVSLLTCGLFAVLPATLTSKTNLSQSLSSGRTSGRGLRFQRLGSALVVADIAMALLLLAGAGLLVNSYARLNADLGYEPEMVLSVQVNDYRLKPIAFGG